MLKYIYWIDRYNKFIISTFVKIFVDRVEDPPSRWCVVCLEHWVILYCQMVHFLQGWRWPMLNDLSLIWPIASWYQEIDSCWDQYVLNEVRTNLDSNFWWIYRQDDHHLIGVSPTIPACINFLVSRSQLRHQSDLLRGQARSYFLVKVPKILFSQVCMQTNRWYGRTY